MPHVTVLRLPGLVRFNFLLRKLDAITERSPNLPVVGSKWNNAEILRVATSSNSNCDKTGSIGDTNNGWH